MTREEPDDGGTPARPRYGAPLAIAAAAIMAVSMIRHGTDGQRPPQPGAGDAPAAVAGAPRDGDGGDGPADGPGGGADGSGAGGTGAADGGGADGTPAALAFSRPTRVRVPALGVDAPLTTVGDAPDGGIGAPPPDDRNLAAWYTDGPSPGERGTAVVDGHVDTVRGPAVFYGLGALHKGNTVEVTRSDGGTAVFTVYGVQVFAKDAFPGAQVYGDTGRPELRVITCGGGFTRSTGYDSNVVVFARLSATRPPPGAAGPAPVV